MISMVPVPTRPADQVAPICTEKVRLARGKLVSVTVVAPPAAVVVENSSKPPTIPTFGAVPEGEGFDQLVPGNVPPKVSWKTGALTVWLPPQAGTIAIRTATRGTCHFSIEILLRAPILRSGPRDREPGHFASRHGDSPAGRRRPPRK